MGGRRTVCCSAFVLYSDLSITVCLVLKEDYLTAIGGTALLAVVTTLAVIALPPPPCVVHMAWSVVVLAAMAARAAVTDSASGWVIASHVVTMVLMFSAPMLLVIYVGELRSRARESLVDPLTGLHNRRGLFAAVDAIVVTSGAGAPSVMAAVVVDIDGMKGVNDPSAITPATRCSSTSLSTYARSPRTRGWRRVSAGTSSPVSPWASPSPPENESTIWWHHSGRPG